MRFRSSTTYKTAFALMGIYFLVGCTDVKPQVSFLKALETFELRSSEVVTSDLTAVSVVAKCSAYIVGVELSFDGGSTWIDSAGYDSAAVLDCSNNKTFSMTLSNTKAPWSGVTVAAGTNLNVQFRARSRMGSYTNTTLQVLFNPSLSISQEVLVGSQKQTGTGLQAHSRLRFQQQEIATGGGFIIRGRILR